MFCDFSLRYLLGRVRLAPSVSNSNGFSVGFFEEPLSISFVSSVFLLFESLPCSTALVASSLVYNFPLSPSSLHDCNWSSRSSHLSTLDLSVPQPSLFPGLARDSPEIMQTYINTIELMFKS